MGEVASVMKYREALSKGKAWRKALLEHYSLGSHSKPCQERVQWGGTGHL